MKTPIRILILFLCPMLLSSCIGYHEYEKVVKDAERFKALYVARQDSITKLATLTTATLRKNELLEHEGKLTSRNLETCRLQYSLLEATNSDVMGRYDRLLAHDRLELMSNEYETKRLSEAAARREQEVQRRDAMVLTLEREKLEVQAQLQLVQQPRAHTQLPSPRASTQVAYPENTGVSYKRISALPPTARELAASEPESNSRAVASAKQLEQSLLANVTGYTFSELSIQSFGEYVLLQIKRDLLFPGHSSDIGQLGAASLRQTARSLAEFPNTSIRIVTGTDLSQKKMEADILAQRQLEAIANIMYRSGQFKLDQLRHGEQMFVDGNAQLSAEITRQFDSMVAIVLRAEVTEASTPN